MLTRDEFENARNLAAQRMMDDAEIMAIGDTLIEKGVNHMLAYQASWMGEPIMQYPQDLFAIQELIYDTKPDYVIEVGVAWAGSLLFYNDVMRSSGGKGVIGIDVFIPTDLRERLAIKAHNYPGIKLIEGGSTLESTLSKVREVTNGSGNLLIHLDSDHTNDHVFSELKLYSALLDEGKYIICGDTHVENLPAGTYKNKPYDKGNNPMIALERFLQLPEGSNFEVDTLISGKYLLSLNPSGYLVRR
jgi:cephalosporin hydroxylase